jgi:hypothetical protein
MNYGDMAQKLEDAGCRTFWFGPVERGEVDELGRLLGFCLPDQFAEFLCELGGGGVEGAELTGIDGAAAKDGYGTVWGDTKRLREEFALDDHLVVVRVDSEEYAWCLDCSASGNSGVVGVALGVDSTPTRETVDFAAYFKAYVADQIAIESGL